MKLIDFTLAGGKTCVIHVNPDQVDYTRPGEKRLTTIVAINGMPFIVNGTLKLVNKRLQT